MQAIKLADLMYGHGEKFICHLSGRFAPEKYPEAPPIQLCQMKCECWIVVDGNSRIGLILRKNPEATIADIPQDLIATARFGDWDNDTMDWWNPCPVSFRKAMGKRNKITIDPKSAIYGIIERNEDYFFAVAFNVKNIDASATGRTADEAKARLEQKIKTILNRNEASLILTPMSPLEDHRCSQPT